MKTFYLKPLILTLCFLAGAGLLWSQDPNSDDPDPGATITPDPTLFAGFTNPAQTPVLKAESVISYSDGISIALEFGSPGMTPQNVVFVDQSNAANVRSLTVANGSTEFFGATPGRIYNVKAIGSDGQTYIIGTVNTNAYKAGEAVKVSDALYRALSQYVTISPQTVTLTNYLKQLPNVSQHEKISFLQRYAMNGAVLPASIKGQYPDAYVRSALQQRAVSETCMCNFVMNQVTIAIPDESGTNDFTIGMKEQGVGPTFYNSASYYARGRREKGAAKYQYLLNEGLRAGRKKRTETWTSGADNISDNSVRIGYHLLCVGVNELPAECDCEKTIKYSFGYSTHVEARTNTGGFGCVLEQNAAARAQDWAAVFVTRERVNNVNDVQIFQTGLGVATSKCDGGVPVSVILDAAKIGVSVFQVIKSVKTAQLNDIVNQTNEIIDKVNQLLLPATSIIDCNSAVTEKPLLQGTATITFKPNDPLSFVLMSGSVLEVSGVRCWSSLARINSSFHLAGVVSGGAPSPTTPHCCTNYFANWAYASLNNDESNQRNNINAHLALNSPGGWQYVNGLLNPVGGGGINIPTEIGYAMGVHLPEGQTCQKEIPIFNNPH